MSRSRQALHLAALIRERRPVFITNRQPSKKEKRRMKNTDLTVEYIVARAFALGALSIYSVIEPGYRRRVEMVWPCPIGGTMTSIYSMEQLPTDLWQVSWAKNLPAMHRNMRMWADCANSSKQCYPTSQPVPYVRPACEVSQEEAALLASVNSCVEA